MDEEKKQVDEQKDSKQEQEAKAGAGAEEQDQAMGEAEEKGEASQAQESSPAEDGEAFYKSKLEELRDELKRVKEGSHERVQELDKALQHRKLLSVEDAQRMRELRIKEAEALYAYDVKAANESYDNSYRDVQSKIAGEVEESIKRLQALREGMAASDGDEATDEGAGGMDLDGESNSGAPSAEGPSKRASVPGGYGSESLGMNFFMTENSIYDDLRAIQQDWKSRAETFLSQGEAAKECVRVEDGVLYYEEHILEKDQDVVCYTEVSKEQIQGTIQNINASEVIVKLLDGSLSRVLITYLRSGRCTIGPLMDEA
ncbi:Sin3 histone deacetylase corepressor complex component SDS3 [Hondaea fermentalgiana]|uniref:Sin3 histone deacetylase corepressor complex component SDS3 n=1 Tax=Hondaea fermentalgiana TaxID=2315210 RepID=A0A2R5G7T3_9STRA|nr:Sin3 histone deacetylase corepressor complex component SDS3 [Hondaea fermentalgiana]|eukprot:GBG27097.1 Sin3 histone deacetylase corepressor complex component SDS3 [Hondaea fermentalgiana]